MRHDVIVRDGNDSPIVENGDKHERNNRQLEVARVARHAFRRDGLELGPVVNVCVFAEARMGVVVCVLLIADGRGQRSVVLALPVLRQAIVALSVPRSDADRIVARVDREDGDEEEEEELDGASAGA